jgi:uncharacterized RDD family membrane protein YckC
MKSITYVAPHKTALTVSLVFAISSLLLVIPMTLIFSFMPMYDQAGNPVNSGFPMGVLLAMPVFYFIFGYIFTGIAAWLYNKVAMFTGGIKYEAVE